MAPESHLCFTFAHLTIFMLCPSGISVALFTVVLEFYGCFVSVEMLCWQRRQAEVHCRGCNLHCHLLQASTWHGTACTYIDDKYIVHEPHECNVYTVVMQLQACDFVQHMYSATLPSWSCVSLE